MKLEIEITDEQLEELLDCAFDGGIGYWALGLSVQPDVNGTYAEIVLKRGGRVTLRDQEDDGAKHVLDRAAIERGLPAFQKQCPKRFSDWFSGECDAGCGDAFVQCCLFGKVIYG